MTSVVELCSKCQASLALTSYQVPFDQDFARAYRNPTQFEASCIEESLRNASADLAVLVQEIKRFESILHALKAHQTCLDSHIQLSRLYLCPSPIRRLPTEVLGLIFASACTSFQRSEYKTPLSISVVCSKWHDIAVSTPSLWTHIYVAPYDSHAGLDVYKHYLERCGNVPISVKVKAPYKHQYEDTYDELVSAIFQSCAHWKVAELCMTLDDIELLKSRGRELALLESLTLVDQNKGSFLAQHGLFDKAPVLASFTLKTQEVWDVGSVVDALPWGQLRQFCTEGSALRLNRREPNNMTYLHHEFEDGNNRTLVIKPSLRKVSAPLSLHVSALVLDSMIWKRTLLFFFQNVTIPTLQSLTIVTPDTNTKRSHFTFSKWTNPFSVLPTFLARSGCALQTFTVIMRGRYIYQDPDEGSIPMKPTLADSLVDALHCMKDLRALHIIEPESGPSLFNERLFQEMTGGGHLLPEATSLEMVWAEDRQPVDALITMLSARSGQGAAGMGTLSSVVLGLRNGGVLRGDVLECMAILRQRGIRATLW